MKKILLLLISVALLAGGAGVKTQAQVPSQRHVYFSEGFSDATPRYDTTVWNVESEVDTGYRRLFFSTIPSTGGLSPEAVWGYQPDGGLTEVLRDTLRMTTKPIALQAASRAYVSMKYVYQSLIARASADGVRSFGLAARQPGGAWMPCGIVGNGGLKAKMGPERLIAELPVSLENAKEVEVCVYLQNRLDVAEMKNYYRLYFDDIEFYAYPEAYYDLAFAWDGHPYAFVDDEEADLDVDLQLENIGNTLQSGKIAYTFDGGAVQYLNLALEDPLMPGQTHELDDFEPAGWAEAAEGHHELVFWLAEANGVALAETAVAKQRKTLSKMNRATVTTYPSKPLVEEFTSSSCPACASSNKMLQPVFDAFGDSLSVVKYQMYFPGKGDPYYTGEGGQRKEFYDVKNITDLYLNGWHEVGLSTIKLVDFLREKVQEIAYFDLSFDTLALDTSTNVYIVLSLRSSLPMDGVLHTAVIERQTEGNASTNGETEFQHVMLKMLPHGGGLPVSIKPDTVYTFRYAYDMTKTFMEESDDLKVVCFLQAADDTVLQSAIGDVNMRIDKAPGTDKPDKPDEPGTANERLEAYTLLEVYPNPASEQVTLPALNAATVEVFDMAGHRAFQRYGVQGDYQLNVRDFRPGNYVIKVMEAGRTAWAKISVVR